MLFLNKSVLFAMPLSFSGLKHLIMSSLAISSSQNGEDGRVFEPDLSTLYQLMTWHTDEDIN